MGPSPFVLGRALHFRSGACFDVALNRHAWLAPDYRIRLATRAKVLWANGPNTNFDNPDLFKGEKRKRPACSSEVGASLGYDRAAKRP